MSICCMRDGPDGQGSDAAGGEACWEKKIAFGFGTRIGLAIGTS
jgi:hypothetical protein